MTNQKWPQQIWLVRHGQSAGNVARDLAESNGFELIDIAERDIDVPLSPLGEQQAQALGRWFHDLPVEQRPTVVLSSPYIRAWRTAQIILDGMKNGDHVHTFISDERLREKEFGILDRLTRFGIAQKHPELHEQRTHVGKFYFRPPGGESWCDVILRLRSALDSVSLHYEGKRVLIVAHQVVVLCMRYLIENMDEKTILEIDARGDVANCAVTEYAFHAGTRGSGGLKLKRYNFVAPLDQENTPVTSAPDANVAAR